MTFTLHRCKNVSHGFHRTTAISVFRCQNPNYYCTVWDKIHCYQRQHVFYLVLIYRRCFYIYKQNVRYPNWGKLCRLFVIVDTCSVKWQVLILDESLFFPEAIYSLNLQEGHNMYFFLFWILNKNSIFMRWRNPYRIEKLPFLSDIEGLGYRTASDESVRIPREVHSRL